MTCFSIHFPPKQPLAEDAADLLNEAGARLPTIRKVSCVYAIRGGNFSTLAMPLKTVTHLILTGCGLTDEGLATIVHPLLKSLGIGFNAISERGLDALKQCQQLQELDLRGTGLAARVILAFSSTMPRIRTYYVDTEVVRESKGDPRFVFSHPSSTSLPPPDFHLLYLKFPPYAQIPSTFLLLRPKDINVAIGLGIAMRMSSSLTPPALQRYRAASQHAEESLPLNPSTMSLSALLELLNTLHEMIEGKSSSYRQASMCVLRTYQLSRSDETMNLWDLANMLEQEGRLPLALAVKKFITVLAQYGTEDFNVEYAESQGRLSKEDVRLLNEIMFFPPAAEKVPVLFEQFALSLQQKALLGEHPLNLACFAHQQIGAIHPWGNGNGKTARLFMNMLLMSYGYPPVLFNNEDEYMRNVAEDGPFPSFVASRLRAVYADLHSPESDEDRLRRMLTGAS